MHVIRLFRCGLPLLISHRCVVWPESPPHFIPYLTVYRVENYVVYSISKYGIKGKHPLVGSCGSGDQLLASGVGILRLRRRIPPPDASNWSPSLHHPIRGVFLWHCVATQPYMPHPSIFGSKYLPSHNSEEFIATVVFLIYVSRIQYQTPNYPVLWK